VREISGITPTGKPLTQEDEATVTTLSESTMMSQSITRTEAFEKFNKIGSNIRNLSYRHKKVEAGLECLETAVALQLNTLFRCFELHHNRLERLEAANERQVAIQTKHLQLTLDPVAAQRDGTFSTLKKLLTQELHQARQDKILLETERAAVFEGTHEEDQDYIERKHTAGKLYDYFHAKINEKEDSSEFDIAQLSDVSDDETIASHDLTTESTGRDATPDQEIVDEAMPDATDSNNKNAEHSQDETAHQGTNKSPETTLNPPVITHQTRETPLSWDSDIEDDEVITQPTSEQQWTTTPSRVKQVLDEPTGDIRRANTKDTSKARNLFKKAFPSEPTANRFSPLQEDFLAEDMDTTMITTGSVPYSPPQDDDPSYKEMDNADNLLDDSIDDMSLISNNELDDLAIDSLQYDEDGYDTDTTDNTSPSKPSKTSYRKSSLHARLRISELYTAPDALLGNIWDGADSKSVSLSTSPTPIPHPPLNTPTDSGGHGAEIT
jgi:hypothetical protein